MSFKRSIVDVANLFLAPFNAEIVGRDAIPSWQHFFRLAKRYDFKPASVFDIGVAYGTPWLYEAYPKAFYYLIDPLRESLPHMEKIAKTLDAKILSVALGDHSGEIEIDVHENIGGSTTFSQEGIADSAHTTSYSVQVRRLDELVDKFDTPALCKIDVQGAELDVLKGMTGIIDAIEIVIVECHTIPTLKGIPEVYQVIQLMDTYGFSIYDILSLGRRPWDGATAELDIAFVRKNSVFLADKRWR